MDICNDFKDMNYILFDIQWKCSEKISCGFERLLGAKKTNSNIGEPWPGMIKYLKHRSANWLEYEITEPWVWETKVPAKFKSSREPVNIHENYDYLIYV